MVNVTEEDFYYTTPADDNVVTVTGYSYYTETFNNVTQQQVVPWWIKVVFAQIHFWIGCILALLSNSTLIYLIVCKHEFHTQHYRQRIIADDIYSATELVYAVIHMVPPLLNNTAVLCWFCTILAPGRSVLILSNQYLLVLIAYEQYIFICKPYIYLQRFSERNTNILSNGHNVGASLCFRKYRPSSKFQRI